MLETSACHSLPTKVVSILQNSITEDVFWVILQRVSLHNGSDTYEMFVQPTIPIYLEVYVFDLRNPQEVLAGKQKPYVQQRGPYVYR